MDFNSILIGSDDPRTAGRLLHEAVRRAELYGDGELHRLAARQLGSSRSGRTPRSRDAVRSPGRLIWNIETD